jgi:uncharacterized protein
MTMDCIEIIQNVYPEDAPSLDILLTHSRQVRDKALQAAERAAHLNPDTEFIAEAAMLHDIGMIRTSAPSIGCRGTEPYIRHGVIGRAILEEYDLPRHGLVCERHIGVGLGIDDIERQGLPLPRRNMLPIGLEEIIVCYADTFFSKTNGFEEHALEKVLADVGRFGRENVDRFMQWHRILGEPQ